MAWAKWLFIWMVLLASGLAAQDLSDKDRARLLKDRRSFLEAAATATEWFGDPRGLNAQAVEDYVAACRASRRADAMVLILQADLSGDGLVTRAEVARLAPALSPGTRGRLIAGFDAGDADGDGRLTAAELTGFAQAEALRLFPDDRARDLRLILLFDTDGDGWVRYDEVAAKLKEMRA